MDLGGYAHRIAHIDLSTKKIDYKPIPEEWALKYIGGRGLGVKYVFENGPEVDPLSPKNILCFMNGPLTGTEANMSGRMAVVTKSPLTGTVTDSHHGGWSAARLRWAGFDGLIFKGKADKPVYAYIEDQKVELRGCIRGLGQGCPRHGQIFQKSVRRKRPDGDCHWPGGRKTLTLCLLGKRERPRQRPRRYGLRGRQQESESRGRQSYQEDAQGKGSRCLETCP